jgi:hypothetical protein
MSDQPVRFTPLGNLDKDSEYKLVGKGNYIDALDIIKQDDGEQVSGTIQPTKRNKPAFSLGSVQAQNKKYRVTVSGDATKSHALKFLSTKRDYRITTGTGANGEVEFNGTISSLQSAFNASNLPGAFQVTVSGNTVEFELVAYNYYQWHLESVGDDDVDVVCIQEAIPTDLVGPLKDIGSYDLLGDLFVFSTTQDNEPTELDVQIAGVGPVSPNPSSPPPNVFSGPLTQLFFNGPHGLQEGQWIRIIDSSAAWLNGTFVVNNIISPTDVNIVTDTAWGATHPASSVGPAKVFIHPTGIGEIGVAQKNNSTESWTYTRLLRSVELNFVSKWAIDCHAHKDQRGVNEYYTDDYNQPRKFEYDGPYVQDGALSHVVQDNIYSYGDISYQSAMVLSAPVVKFELVSQNQTGGGLFAGNKYYHVRAFTSSGDQSRWSASSGAVNVFLENFNSSPAGLISGNNSIQTTKSNTIRIIGLNSGAYGKIEVAVVEDIEGVLTSKLIKTITVNSSTIEFTHTGNESDIQILDIGEFVIGSDAYLPIKAKSIRSIDSMNVLSNVETLDKIDLSEWTKTFRHSIERKYITEATGFQKGEYQDPQTVFNDMGFMLNETYRIGVRAYIRNLGRTDIFWVDDIKVDTNAQNTSNPFGIDRRNNTILNFDLSEEAVPIATNILEAANIQSSVVTGSPNDPQWENQLGVKWDTGWERYENGEFFNDSSGQPLNLSSASRLIVPYIKIEDIDYSFVITELGTTAEESIEALEFFVGDIPNSVKASGIGIMSVKVRDDSNNVYLNPLHVQGGTTDDIAPLTFGRGPTIESESYIIEYPYATGSAIPYKFPTADTFYQAINYPLPLFDPSNQASVGFNSEVRNIVSFYSGDTVFSDNDFKAKELIVFGGMELKKQIKAKLSTYDYDNVSGANRKERPYSFWANFHPSLTGSSFTSYQIDNQEFIDPETLPNIRGIHYERLTDTDGSYPDSWYYGFSGTGYRPTENDLYASDIGGSKFSKRIPFTTVFYDGLENSATSNTVSCSMANAKGPVLNLAADIDFNDPNISPSFINNKEVFRYGNRGVIYCQLYSDQSDNIPEIRSTKYRSVGSMYITPNDTSQAQHSLTCGDTFTQTTIIKHRFPDITESNLAIAGSSAYDVAGLNLSDPSTTLIYAEEIHKVGFGSGLIVVCQNRVNANMFTEEEDQSLNQIYYPRDLIKDWLTCFQFQSIQKYNDSYNADFNIRLSAYLSAGIAGGANYDFPTRIMYSLKKDESGIYDEYRVFLPLNFKDLDITFGDIEHHESVNGELFTLQRRKYQLQYFNTRGTLQGSNSGVEVLIGDGSVLSRDGQTLSSYGTSHKWSVVKGSSPGGKDVIYWFNQENGLFMRFGADGTVVLSERHGMRSFSANNTRWTENQHTPTLNYGIRSVWDDRFKEAIWTFIGLRSSQGEWGTLPSNQLYAEGDTVTNNTFINYPFDGVPDVYVSLSIHAPIPQSEPGVGNDWETYWRRVDKDDPEYYSVFTIAFNELSNGFSTFYSHLPKTYLKWKNKFLSSHPTERSEMYEHRLGYDKWYEYEGVWKESEPYLEGVVNPFPDQSKKFVAIQALTDNVPDRIELKTKDHESFLVATDFDAEDDAWRTPIKNDILTSQTGDPNDDTESLVGAYMRIKFKFFNGAYNKLNNLVVKVRQRLRRT